MSRTRVPRWTPPLRDSIKLAWRPALSYLIFTGLGSLVMVLTGAFYSHGSRDAVLFALGTAAGMFGVVLGQFLAVLRLRALPVFVVSALFGAFAVWVMTMSSPPGGDYLAVPAVFFSFAFPCGLLSLMHRYELFASFWPAVGWIGGVFIILNEEHRVHDWEENKVSAWLPIPLVYLGCFLVLWLFYLAAKQAARVEMWQALSGAAGRRIARKEARQVSALPRKNILALLGFAILLFAGTAILGPFLWRTGKGDRESTDGKETELPKPPEVDGEGLARQFQQIAEAAAATLPKLWPLLLLVVLYRPLKRLLLLRHLTRPLVPTPPSERIDNLWEYVRIAAEDAGIALPATDSVEQMMARIREEKRSSVALERAAEIYARTRYGFTVAPGDPEQMRGHALAAAEALRLGLGPLRGLKNLWRGLA